MRISGRNRLKLKFNIFKTGGQGDLAQFIFSAPVAGGVKIAEMHRTPHHNAVARTIGKMFGLMFQVADKMSQNLFKTHHHAVDARAGIHQV